MPGTDDTQKVLDGFVYLLVINDDGFYVAGKVVTHNPYSQVLLLVYQGRGR